MIGVCKDFLKAKLAAVGVPEAQIRTTLQKGGRYEIPNSAILLVAEDTWERLTGTAADKFDGTTGKYTIFRNRYTRKLILELTLIGKNEAWVDGKVEALAPMERTIMQPDAILDEDVRIDVAIQKIEWDDIGALLPGVYAAQVYVEFTRPYLVKSDEPYYYERASEPDHAAVELTAELS